MVFQNIVNAEDYTRFLQLLEVGWRSAGGRLEVGWRSAGGRLEVGWRSAGDRLEIILKCWSLQRNAGDLAKLQLLL